MLQALVLCVHCTVYCKCCSDILCLYTCFQSWAHLTTVATIWDSFRAKKCSPVTEPLHIVIVTRRDQYISEFTASQKPYYVVACRNFKILSHSERCLFLQNTPIFLECCRAQYYNCSFPGPSNMTVMLLGPVIWLECCRPSYMPVCCRAK